MSNLILLIIFVIISIIAVFFLRKFVKRWLENAKLTS
jgi:membrane protein implicated in regulation of membrane protease activity